MTDRLANLDIKTTQGKQYDGAITERNKPTTTKYVSPKKIKNPLGTLYSIKKPVDNFTALELAKSQVSRS